LKTLQEKVVEEVLIIKIDLVYNRLVLEV
jgi:hypothetical protein